MVARAASQKAVAHVPEFLEWEGWDVLTIQDSSSQLQLGLGPCSSPRAAACGGREPRLSKPIDQSFGLPLKASQPFVWVLVSGFRSNPDRNGQFG